MAIFSFSGKIPVSKDSFIRMLRSLEIGKSSTFSILIGILFGPLDLPIFRDLIWVDTSSDVHGEMKNESKLGLDK